MKSETIRGLALTLGSLAIPVLFLVCSARPAVSQSEAGPPGRGRVVAVDGAAGTVTLEHEAIPGLIPATRTEFPVRTPGVLPTLRIGDSIRFAVETSDLSHGLLMVTDVRPDGDLHPATVGPTPRPEASSGVRLSIPLVATVAGLWVSTVALLGAAVFGLSRRLGEVRASLREAILGQASIARDVERVTQTLGEVGAALRVRTQALREGLAAARSPAREEPTPVAGPYVLVLQRGAPDPRRSVWKAPGSPEIVRVVLDRRFDERRQSRGAAAPERRRGERRRSPAPTWITSGFVLIPVTDSLHVRGHLRGSRVG